MPLTLVLGQVDDRGRGVPVEKITFSEQRYAWPTLVRILDDAIRFRYTLNLLDSADVKHRVDPHAWPFLALHRPDQCR